MQPTPNSAPTLSWLWQNLISEGIAAIVIGVLVAIAKKHRPEWMAPLLYGLIGMVLFGTVLYSPALYARWPLWTPIILIGSLIAASAVRLVVALIERNLPAPVASGASPGIDPVTHNRVVEELNECKGKNVDLNNDLAAQKTDCTEAKDKLEERERKVSNLEGQLFRLERNVQTTEIQLSARNSDIDRINEKLWQQQQQSAGLRGDVESLESELKDFSVPSGQIQLIEALYFAPGEEASAIDVVKILQSDIDNRGDGRLWLGADELYQHHFRPDPKPGVQKFLRVDYLHRGKRFSVTVPEDTRTVLPLPYKIIERDRASGQIVVKY
jgi:hypothetical protein